MTCCHSARPRTTYANPLVRVPRSRGPSFNASYEPAGHVRAAGFAPLCGRPYAKTRGSIVRTKAVCFPTPNPGLIKLSQTAPPLANNWPRTPFRDQCEHVAGTHQPEVLDDRLRNLPSQSTCSYGIGHMAAARPADVSELPPAHDLPRRHHDRFVLLAALSALTR
jgi:hypothetical protein